MIKNIKDRNTQYVNRIRLTPLTGNDYTYELVPGTVYEAGTFNNRAVMLAVQKFAACTTLFNGDGSILETNADGDTMLIEFFAAYITETFVCGSTTVIKKTTFNEDGSITEEIL